MARIEENKFTFGESKYNFGVGISEQAESVRLHQKRDGIMTLRRELRTNPDNTWQDISSLFSNHDPMARSLPQKVVNRFHTDPQAVGEWKDILTTNPETALSYICLQISSLYSL